MLQEFVENFNAEFGEVLNSNMAYEEVGIGAMPVFGITPIYDVIEMPKNVIYHKKLRTDQYETEEEATVEIIKKIEEYTKAVVPENHNKKNYKLFWRCAPEINSQVEFDQHKKTFFGYTRLSIVSDK